MRSFHTNFLNSAFLLEDDSTKGRANKRKAISITHFFVHGARSYLNGPFPSLASWFYIFPSTVLANIVGVAHLDLLLVSKGGNSQALWRSSELVVLRFAPIFDVERGPGMRPDDVHCIIRYQYHVMRDGHRCNPKIILLYF